MSFLPTGVLLAPARAFAIAGRCLFVALLVVPGAAEAITPGRSWTPVDTLKLPGHTYLVPDRLEVDTSGVPILIGAARGGLGKDTAGFRWADSTWAFSWRLGYGVARIPPVIAPRGTQYMVWRGLDLVGKPSQSSFVFAEMLADSVTPPDTLGMVYAGSATYSAAVSARRRWAAVGDYVGLRLFYWDEARGWRESEIDGLGGEGVAITTLEDTVALVAWADNPGLRWRVVRGGVVAEGGDIPNYQLQDYGPQFRPRPSGGQWMGWGTQENFVAIATYRSGAWSAPESLWCNYPSPDPYYSQPPDLSRDEGEYPAVAWCGYNGRTGVEIVCACVATDSGFARADAIETSEHGCAPRVARDRNGDVWVAWWRFFDGAFWVHSYTSVTGSAPVVHGDGEIPVVSWTLSGPAPETWWAVLRAVGDGPYEEVARVRAGAGPKLTWTDTTAPEGLLLRYRVRRESVDSRYRWYSDEATWRPRAGLGLSLRGAHPTLPEAELSLAGAEAGPLDLRVYDLQGRLVHRQRLTAGGSGLDTIHLDFSTTSPKIKSGVYFVTVVDAGGRVSSALKLVVLR